MSAIFLGSIAMTLMRFPNDNVPFSVFTIFIPFVPAAFLLAATAVFFESTVFLRKAWGTVVYFSVVIFLIVVVAADLKLSWVKYIDFTGFQFLFDYFREEVLRQSGKPLTDFSFILVTSASIIAGPKQLVFGPLVLDWADIAVFLVQFGVAVSLVFLSSTIYSHMEKTKQPKLALGTEEQESAMASLANYNPAMLASKGRLAGGVIGELKLMLSGVRVSWMVVALAGIAASAFAPIGYARIIVLLEMLWCLSLFSEMGCREHIYDTLKCVAVLPKGRIRQIMFSWISGIIIAFAAVLPVFVRMLASGNFLGAFSCVCGAVFVPSIAIFLGEWSHTHRAFEIIFVIVTYICLNDSPFMYLELRPEYLNLAQVVVILVAGILAGFLAVAKRATVGSRILGI
jgi:hypothetical protein